MKRLSVSIEIRTNESVFGRLISRVCESGNFALQYIVTSLGILFLRNVSLTLGPSVVAACDHLKKCTLAVSGDSAHA